MGGFLDVQPSKVTILTEAAERAAEIDKLRAEKAKERAEIQAANVKDTQIEAALSRALVRLRAVEVLESTRGFRH
jgi:F-type H+-transporting ATPase subunit epsilon